MNVAPLIPYKVIHLSTTHTGGAGIAARRLNKELNNFGILSSFYSLGQRGYNPSKNEFVINRSKFKVLYGKTSVIAAKILSKTSFFSIFSTSAISMNEFRNRFIDNQTILHFHNWFNLISQRQLIKLIDLGIPIVFTLHDQRLITGGCHYSLGCHNFKSGCKMCPITPVILRTIPTKNARKLSNAFMRNLDTVKFVSPSNYLKTQASQSFVLKSHKVDFIPNVLSDFHISGLNHLRENTNKEKFIVGVASMNPSLVLKGGDLIDKLKSDSKFKENYIDLIYLASFSESDQSVFWKSIDCLLVPSRADNSPNVIHEAKSLGIPVIATRTGGISELLTKNFDVAIELEDLSTDSILVSILSLKNKTFSKEQRNLAKENLQNYSRNSIQDLLSVYTSF
jgi:glycosyltransferase involved in cell wall biosynthesis